MSARYYIKEFTRNRWHVIGPSGLPLYDNSPHGNDKPLVLTDEDDALDYAQRCEAFSDESEQ